VLALQIPGPEIEGAPQLTVKRCELHLNPGTLRWEARSGEGGPKKLSEHSKSYLRLNLSENLQQDPKPQGFIVMFHHVPTKKNWHELALFIIFIHFTGALYTHVWTRFTAVLRTPVALQVCDCAAITGVIVPNDCQNVTWTPLKQAKTDANRKT
jgi:hypothetical protein